MEKVAAVQSNFCAKREKRAVLDFSQKHRNNFECCPMGEGGSCGTLLLFNLQSAEILIQPQI